MSQMLYNRIQPRDSQCKQIAMDQVYQSFPWRAADRSLSTCICRAQMLKPPKILSMCLFGRGMMVLSFQALHLNYRSL